MYIQWFRFLSPINESTIFGIGTEYIDRVLSFLSSSPYWDSPTPSHAGECVPPPPPPPAPGVSTLAWGRGGGGSQFQRGDRHCGTLGVYVLCGLRYESHELHNYTLRYGQSPASLQLKQRTSRHSKGDQVYYTEHIKNGPLRIPGIYNKTGGLAKTHNLVPTQLD